MQFINAGAHSPLWAQRQPVLDWGLGNSYKVPAEYPAKPMACFVKTFWLFYPPKTQTKLFLVYKVSNYSSHSCPLSIKCRMKQYSKLHTRKHSKTVLDTHPMLVYWEDYENLVPFFTNEKHLLISNTTINLRKIIGDWQSCVGFSPAKHEIRKYLHLPAEGSSSKSLRWRSYFYELTVTSVH